MCHQYRRSCIMGCVPTYYCGQCHVSHPTSVCPNKVRRSYSNGAGSGTDMYAAFYQSIEWRRLRNKMRRERKDNKNKLTCTVCGKQGISAQCVAHHIYPIKTPYGWANRFNESVIVFVHAGYCHAQAERHYYTNIKWQLPTHLR